jgi:hypothetical protein
MVERSVTTKFYLLATGLLISAFALGGCDSATEAVSDTLSDALLDITSDDPVDEVAGLIASDDPKACAHKTAIDVALQAASDSYESYLADGGPPMSVDTISALGIDESIHEITCKGLLRYETGDYIRSTPFTYKLRPSLDDGGGFVAEGMKTRGVQAAMSLQVNGWYLTRSKEQNSSADYATTDDQPEKQERLSHTPRASEEAPIDRGPQNIDELKENVAASAANPGESAAAPDPEKPSY